MPSYTYPGSFVEEKLLPPEPAGGANADAAGAFIGGHTQGPTTPVLCRSWTDFQKHFGGFSGNSALPFAVYSFYQNGGREAYVVRAIGTGAAKATRTINDQAATPLASYQIDAVSEGAWGNNIAFDIANGTSGNLFNLTIRYNGVQVEQFNDLSRDTTSSRSMTALVNGISNYVTISALASGDATASPLNRPAVTSNVSLAGGADGAAPTDASYTAATAALDTVDRPLVLNLPAVDGAATLATVLGWAQTRGDVFVVVDPAVGRTAAQVITDSAALTATSYGAVYYPWLTVSDPSSSTQGATRLIPPGGAVVGQYMATDALVGPHKAAAGLGNQIRGAVALERKLTNTELGDLNSASTPVNVIRQVPGAGICIMGARTLKGGLADKYIPIRRNLIYIRKTLLDITRFAIFRPNDADLWGDLRSTCMQFLMEVYTAGGLRGATPAQAFYVKCDGSLNGPAQIQNGEVRVEVGVSLQYPAEFIVITLGQFEAGATATTSV